MNAAPRTNPNNNATKKERFMKVPCEGRELGGGRLAEVGVFPREVRIVAPEVAVCGGL